MGSLPSFPWLQRRAPGAWCRTALGRDPSLQGAVNQVFEQLRGAGQADLALVFASGSYASDLQRLLPLLQEKLSAGHWLGCVGGGVVGTDPAGTPHEVEQQPALAVTLLHLPGASLHPFAIDTADLPDLDGPAEPWRERVGADLDEGQSMLLLLDPTGSAINDLINGLDYAFPQATKVGGIAGPHSAAHGSLLFDDGDGGDTVRTGAVGCLIGGAWRLDPVVAQGCRPIGPVLEVEQAQRNVVIEVSCGDTRNSPVAALQAILTDLTPAEREQVKHSLFLGVGRNDFSLPTAEMSCALEAPGAFLVRNLIGVDPRNGAVAVGERMRVGQKVQFQLRDADASRDESRQLLAAQARRQSEPLVALLFACLGRGEGLYGEADGDVNLCREVFGTVPIAGLFCNGEIGPVGGTTHLHGYTASWGFLVPNEPSGGASAPR
ncbi:FIST N-terminal domain-containing protein [Synechococcus sp. CCY 9618]|uniref:FIST signal transduction protein n=1 Tax=Synechococcus sp. CCY 9618 TaxID=2815602 RepID=UPI001C22C436|nr:FIST N-terminal domain-containing protein [Synechococcus sp. CCY 9618]